MSIQDLQISKTDADVDSLTRHLYNCKESFPHFLRTEVKTIDPQARIYERSVPEWPYLFDTAQQFQDFDRNIILKSRQLMLTWEVSAFAVWQAIFHPPSLGLIISKGGRYSRETGDRANYIIKHLSFSNQITVKTNAQYNEYSFPGIAENKFQCLPADEDVVRTFSPSYIILDEAAYFPYPGRLLDAVGPLLEAGVKFIILSTPNGHDVIFYPMWTNPMSDINKIELWWYQRPDHGDDWWEALQKRPGMTAEKIAREYGHSFKTPAGKPVYEIWNSRQAQKCFDLYSKNKPIIRGFDRGFDDPAIVFAQVNDDDQLMILHSEKGNHIAREKWLKHCEDLTKSLFPEHHAGYIDYGAADFSKPESEGESWRKVMKNYGIHLKDKQKDDIDRRLTAVRTKMQLRQDGKFGIIVDPDHCDDSKTSDDIEKRCQFLLEGLQGAYCYPDKPDYQGKLKPLKNQYSHEADCVGHICDNHFNVHGEARGKYNYEPYIPEYDENGRPL